MKLLPLGLGMEMYHPSMGSRVAGASNTLKELNRSVWHFRGTGWKGEEERVPAHKHKKNTAHQTSETGSCFLSIHDKLQNSEVTQTQCCGFLVRV